MRELSVTSASAGNVDLLAGLPAPLGVPGAEARAWVPPELEELEAGVRVPRVPMVLAIGAMLQGVSR